MGGERVKELDHFVASVKTPVVNFTVGKDGRTVPTGMEFNTKESIAMQMRMLKELLADSVRVVLRREDFGSLCLDAHCKASVEADLPEVLVARQYNTPALLEQVVWYGTAFWWLLSQVTIIQAATIQAATI